MILFIFVSRVYRYRSQTEFGNAFHNALRWRSQKITDYNGFGGDLQKPFLETRKPYMFD